MTTEKDFLAATDLVPAAVLIPLIVPARDEPRGAPSNTYQLSTPNGALALSAETRVVLTVRTHTVAHHKGQISFPGGAAEPGDESLAATALRECQEEIGLDPSAVRIVAELPEVPTVATKFRVRPYVGLIEGLPSLRPNPSEIGEIVMAPLGHLVDPANSKLENYERAGLRYQMRTYYYGSHRIWGATGRMLQILLEKYVSKT